MWTCQNCSEQLEDQFFACWKCGTMRDGRRIAEFKPDPEGDVADEGPEETPPLRLPTATYFSIPVFLLLGIVHNCYIEWNGRPGTPQELLERITPGGWVILITVCVLEMLFVGIPFLVIFFRMTKQWARKEPNAGPGFRFLLLPAEFRERYPWFTPVYYGSIILYVAASVGLMLWLFWKDVSQG